MYKFLSPLLFITLLTLPYAHAGSDREDGPASARKKRPSAVHVPPAQEDIATALLSLATSPQTRTPSTPEQEVARLRAKAQWQERLKQAVSNPQPSVVMNFYAETTFHLSSNQAAAVTTSRQTADSSEVSKDSAFSWTSSEHEDSDDSSWRSQKRRKVGHKKTDPAGGYQKLRISALSALPAVTSTSLPPAPAPASIIPLPPHPISASHEKQTVKSKEAGKSRGRAVRRKAPSQGREEVDVQMAETPAPRRRAPRHVKPAAPAHAAPTPARSIGTRSKHPELQPKISFRYGIPAPEAIQVVPEAEVVAAPEVVAPKRPAPKQFTPVARRTRGSGAQAFLEISEKGDIAIPQGSAHVLSKTPDDSSRPVEEIVQVPEVVAAKIPAPKQLTPVARRTRGSGVQAFLEISEKGNIAIPQGSARVLFQTPDDDASEEEGSSAREPLDLLKRRPLIQRLRGNPENTFFALDASGRNRVSQ